YRLYFTDFSGGSSGNLSFNFENVTQALGIEKVGENITFGVYPNPVKLDKKINIIFDIQKVELNDNIVEIYNLVGKRVLRTKITNTQGFYEKEIDLNSLNSGVYILKFNSGGYQKSKKIVIQ
ncbi:MAG: T9SS type A sorting domain-containing protein, partial [Polaribacter sp.]|nr:T9SS type A sorting domain-containing protein [Polaribacter sp.]